MVIECGRKVSDDEMDALRLYQHKFHGEWNYTLVPNTPKRSLRVRQAIDRLVSSQALSPAAHVLGGDGAAALLQSWKLKLLNQSIAASEILKQPRE